MNGREPTAWVGAVLTGGASRRMGRDKALLPVDGVTMAGRAMSALRDAGATAVTCVGLEVPGEPSTPDDHPGEGPLGGLLTALRWAPARIALVVACDLLAPSPAAMRRAVDHLGANGQADVAVPVADGRAQWMHAAWWVPTSTVDLGAAFERGIRAIHRAAGELVVHRYDEDGIALADADRPEDLPPGARP